MTGQTIAQALKYKARLLKEYKQILTNIVNENSKPAGSIRYYNVKDLLKEATSKLEELVSLKVKIHRASDPVRDKIFQLSELKSLLQNLSGLDVFEGKKSDYSSSERVPYDVQINQEEKNNFLKQFQNAINNIQDELDVFNAKILI